MRIILTLVGPETRRRLLRFCTIEDQASLAAGDWIKIDRSSAQLAEPRPYLTAKVTGDQVTISVLGVLRRSVFVEHQCADDAAVGLIAGEMERVHWIHYPPD